ncbi:MAG: DNA cytosine methyltransferase [Neptuniibacter sp.]
MSSKVHSVNPPSFISLFSGCGGLDLGFIEAGFKPIAAYDSWPLAVEHYQNNIGKHAYVFDLSDGTLPHNHSCDVVIAGSPCQGFSTIGKRMLNDPRNLLLQSAVKIALSIQPKVIVLENVPGALQGKHKQHWETAIDKLSQSGYKTQTFLIDARKAGVPQSRKRAILIAYQPFLELPTLIPSKTKLSLLEAISNISCKHNHKPKVLAKDSNEHSIASKIQPGQKLCNVRGGSASVHTWEIPSAFGPVTLEEKEVLIALMRLRRRIRVRDFGDADPVEPHHLFKEISRDAKSDVSSLIQKGYIKHVGDKLELKHTFNGKYRRADPDGSSFTVDTRFGDPKCFLHPIEHRGFSVREAARIQTFPDNYLFHGSTNNQFKLIANAVPPKMGQCVGEVVMDAIQRHKTWMTA